MMRSPTTRVSLLLRLRDLQDHDAWVEFVSLYEPATYRLLRRSGLQDADAREVLQDLFLAVSRSVDRWDPARERGSFRGWLRRVARNLVINWLKHRDRRLVATGGSDLPPTIDLLLAPGEPSCDELDQELRRAMFHQAADQVRGEVQPSSWQAFWQTAVLGVSTAEAARQLGLSVGAVRVARCRVLARIRAIVAEQEQAT